MRTTSNDCSFIVSVSVTESISLMLLTGLEQGTASGSVSFYKVQENDYSYDISIFSML